MLRLVGRRGKDQGLAYDSSLAASGRRRGGLACLNSLVPGGIVSAGVLVEKHWHRPWSNFERTRATARLWERRPDRPTRHERADNEANGACESQWTRSKRKERIPIMMQW